MGKAATSGNKKKAPRPGAENAPAHTTAFYERQRKILLDLSDDLTKVREKNDLITLFSSRIKGLFYFTHAIVTLIEDGQQTYKPFLLDPASSPIRNHAEYDALVKTAFDLREPFIREVLHADAPVSFILADIMHLPGSPAFLRVNYEGGVREILMMPLRSKMQTIGFLHVYSDRTDSFTEEFRSIIQGIAPQISSAVSNIIKNDDIRNKERVNEVLLSLSNDMVTVRDRNALLKVINFGLTKLIGFTHSLMTVLNETGETYSAYLTDPASEQKDFHKYTAAITAPNPVADGIYDVAAASDKPVVFRMKDLDMDQAPLWFRLNYKAGAREMLLKVLPGNNRHQHSLILFADVENTFGESAISIIERISSQLSTAASNIAANEEILNKEQEKSFLLEFSNEVARVRTKKDLEQAIFDVLRKMLNTKLAMLRIIEDDRFTLTPYMYDRSLFEKAVVNFEERVAAPVDIHEELTARVLASADAVIFNVDEELRRGNTSPYIQLWKKIGFKNTYGTTLRAGNTDIGTLWLLTDEVNRVLLKGICAQISIAIANILASEKLLAYKRMLEVENDLLKEQIKTIYNFNEIVGGGPAMQQVYHLMTLVAASSSTVLLLGETGTGKELIARAIHNASPRKDKIMIKVNCAALPANLIESELFGHERGAFTGALERRIGKFEQANHSTLFLDEIGEMPPEMQVKLLRVLQEREFERIGGKTTIKVDVRIIAATNRNLEAEVSAGRFRSDLYYRLNVFPIHLPPLRERQEDIPALAHFFVERYRKNAGKKVKSVSPKVMQELKSYPWPGNVRELEHLIERSVLLATENVLREVHLPRNTAEGENEEALQAARTLEEMERGFIIATIKRCGGKLSGPGGAAAWLDVPATTLHSKIKKLGISKSEYFAR